MTAAHIASNLALISLALAALLYLIEVGKNRSRNSSGSAALIALIVATIAGTSSLLLQLATTEATALSGLLLAVAISWMAVIGHTKFKLRLIGAFVAPLATLILLVQFFITPGRPEAVIDDGAGKILLTFHVSMAVLGQAFGILAGAVSIFYLWQQKLLKKKLLSQIPHNLPAIDRIDSMLRVCLWAGYGLITAGLVSGAVYTQLYAPPAELMLSAKVVWATVVWLWYLAILLAQNVFSWPSRRIAEMCLVGFVLMALSYFGIGFFRPGGQ